MALGCFHVQPACLYVERIQKLAVSFIHVNRCAGELAQLMRSCNVVNVGVRNHDSGHPKLMFVEHLRDPADLIAGVYDDRFVRRLISEDGAVAAEQSDGKYLVDHGKRT